MFFRNCLSLACATQFSQSSHFAFMPHKVGRAGVSNVIKNADLMVCNWRKEWSLNHRWLRQALADNPRIIRHYYGHYVRKLLNCATLYLVRWRFYKIISIFKNNFRLSCYESNEWAKWTSGISKTLWLLKTILRSEIPSLKILRIPTE